MNVTGPNWWWVNNGWANVSMLSGNRPLPEPVLTQINVPMLSLGHSDLCCQLCGCWWHQWLLSWGPLVLPVITKLASWQLFVISERCHLTSIGNPIGEIRLPYDCLICTMVFPTWLRPETASLCWRVALYPIEVCDRIDYSQWLLMSWIHLTNTP